MVTELPDEIRRERVHTLLQLSDPLHSPRARRLGILRIVRIRVRFQEADIELPKADLCSNS
jgi:hypothetical protein